MEYMHKVQYYETDKMGITHHSNYIRWMEEARVAFLEKAGYPFDKLEEMGIVSPVLGVTCEYKHPTTFADEITIIARVKEFKGVRLCMEYEMKNAAGVIVCIGTSSHAFLDKNGKPIRMKRDYPGLYEEFVKGMK
jgi:acyl-CoA thioester hydrolase